MHQSKTFLFPFSLKFFIAYFFVIMQCIAKILQPKATNLIIDNGLSRHNSHALYHYIFFFLFIFFLGEICRIMQTILFVNISENLVLNLRSELYNAITRMPLINIKKKESGDIVSRITGELTSVSSFYTQIIPNMVTNILVLFFGILMMGSINKLCTFITLFTLPLIYASSKYFTPKIKTLTKEGAEINSTFISAVEQVINNILVIKNRFNYNYIDFIFKKSANQIKMNKYEITKYSIFVSVLLTLAAFIPNIFIMVWGGNMVLSGKMTIGSLIALNSYAGYLISPIVFFSQSAVSYQQNNVFVSRFNEIISEYYSQEDSNHEKEKITNFKNLSFVNVSFTYDSKTVINKLSFTIKCGDIVQIVGRNGSGKTTLINLLSGLLNPDSGHIIINNKSVDQVDISKIFCIVPQEICLFSDTIENNILLGQADLKQNLIATANELGFNDILSLKTSKTDSKGGNLSGGQAQKINILRALI